MTTRHVSETINLPASGRVQLTLTVRTANQTLLAASYGLIPGEMQTHVTVSDKALCEAWDQAKLKIEEHEIRNQQIVLWFQRHYNLNADLHDFTTKTLPVKFTAAQLQHFCECIDRYAAQN